MIATRMRGIQRGKICKEALPYVLETVICISVIFGAYAARGYYPFGQGTILSWDGYQETGPFSYYVWDVMHGKASLFFNWKIAAGADMLCIYDMISPLNFFYLLIKRSMVPYVQDYFFVIRVVLMALSFQFFLKTAIERRMGIGLNIFCSCIYALSVWSFQFANLSWFLDAAFYVPLLCTFLIKMVEENRGKRRYAIFWALTMLSGVQPAYGAALFVFLFAGIWLLGRCERTKWPEKISLIGIYTLLGIGLSAFFFLPMAIGAATSGRFTYVTQESFFQGFWKAMLADEAQKDKLQFLSGTMGLLVLVNISAFLFCHLRKNRKRQISRAADAAFGFMLFMLLPVFCEGIHLLWQGGKYIAFPLRIGYVIPFSIVFCFAELWCVCFPVLSPKEQTGFWKIRKGQRRVTSLLTAVAALSVIGVVGSDHAKNFMPGGAALKADGLYDQGEALYQRYRGNLSVTERYKIFDAALQSNYGFIADVPVIGNYIHLLPEDALLTNRALGYSQEYTRLSDVGGTVFSDALLGYRYTMSRAIDLSPMMYERQETVGDLQIYRNRYSFPFGFPISSNCADVQVTVEDSPFQNQNRIAKEVLGKEVLKVYECQLDDHKISFTAEHDCAVYFCNESRHYLGDFSNLQIRVCGQDVLCQANTDIDSKDYASLFTNGILYIGTLRQGESVEITFDTENTGTFEMAVCDLEMMREHIPQDVIAEMDFSLREGYIKTEALQDAALFYLPIENIDGFRVSVNHHRVNVKNVFGCYMGVPLEPGQNEIKLVYYPSGYAAGCILTGFSVVLLAGLWFAEKKGFCPESVPILQKSACAVYGTVLVLLAILSVFFISIKLYETAHWIAIRIYWRLAS